MMKCSQLPIVSNTKLRVSPKWFQDYSTQSSLFHPLFFIFLSFACFIFCWAPKWMVAGQVGRRGVAVRLEFARETSAFEQEPAPIQYQVKTELIARETTQNSLIAKVSFQLISEGIIDWTGRKSSSLRYYTNIFIKNIIVVDGGYTEWSQWSLCENPCGGSVVNRSRTCANPTPTADGRTCSGDAFQSKLECISPCPSMLMFLL